MSEFNLNNLMLDDNTFEVLPDGDYHFTVESHEVDYYSGTGNIPANTQQIICHLEIPFMKDGEVATAKVRNTLNVYKKALFAIRQFVECIGMVPEKGRLSVDMDKIDGRIGVCSIVTVEGKNGDFNRVQTFYPPSKVPAVTANDEAWFTFKEVKDGDEDPFASVPD